jgi:hypothetical protein
MNAGVVFDCLFSRLSRPFPVLGSLLVCIALSPAVQAQVILSDTEFDVVNNWTVYGPYLAPTDAQNSAFNAQQWPSGGLPGPYLNISHTLATVPSGAVSSWAALINETLSWEPSELRAGAVAQLSFHIDARRPAGTLDRIYSLALRQDGWLWTAFAKRLFLRENDWVRMNIEDLENADFIALPNVNDNNQPTRPDFSQDGSTIHVGIMTALSCPASSSCTAVVAKQSDIDNFLVTVLEKDAFYINPGLNDAWYYQPTSGQGFFIIVWPDTRQIFISWFTYDAMRPDAAITALIGDPGHRWFTAQGSYEVDTATLTVYQTEGGVFDSEEPKPVTGQQGVGSMTVTWADCDNAVVDYDFLGYSGSVPIERVVKQNVALCEMLQP